MQDIVEAGKDRRAKLVSVITDQTGITEAMIADLVATFYARVRRDPLLSPVFARVKDWDSHLARLGDFWSSVVLMSGRYHGQPMLAHMSLPIEPRHFVGGLRCSSRSRPIFVRRRRPRTSSTRPVGSRIASK
jgi:truncated hemoglobin YjbI